MAVTVTLQLKLRLPVFAMMVAVPAFLPLTMPLEVTVAMVWLLEVQETFLEPVMVKQIRKIPVRTGKI